MAGPNERKSLPQSAPNFGTPHPKSIGMVTWLVFLRKQLNSIASVLVVTIWMKVMNMMDLYMTPYHGNHL